MKSPTDIQLICVCTVTSVILVNLSYISKDATVQSAVPSRVSFRKNSLGEGKLDMVGSMPFLRGSGGMLPQDNFETLSSVRLFLVASETTVTETGRVLL